jgi:hypothetical protein
MVCPSSRHFDRSFDMLLTVNLGEIVFALGRHETGFGSHRFQRRFTPQEIDDLAEAVSAESR